MICWSCIGDAIAWEHTISDYEHKSVAATFASQIQDLERQCPDASLFFRVLAFFDPESIPLEMIVTGAKAIVEEPEPPTDLHPQHLMQSPIAAPEPLSHCISRHLPVPDIPHTRPH